MDLFFHLRKLLTKTPSEKNFIKIIQFFHQWEDNASLETGLGYAQAHLEEWPDLIRKASYRLIWPNFPNGAPIPSASLVRTLLLHPPSSQNGYKDGRWLHINELYTLIHSLPLQGITGLHIVGHPLQRTYENMVKAGRAQMFELLAESTKLPKLHKLAITHTALSDAGLKILAKSPLLQRLTSLTIHSCDENLNRYRRRDGWEAFVSSSGLNNLKELDLADCPLESNIHTLASSSSLQQLTKLVLRGQPAHVNLAKTIAQNPAFSKLTSLDLSNNQLDSTGIHSLVHSRYLSRLTSLQLSGNCFGKEGLRAISEFQGLPDLKSLAIRNCALSAESFQHFASSNFQELEELDCSQNPLTGEGLIALAQAKGFGKLKKLNMSKCQISGEGWEAFAKAKKLESLEELILSHNELRDKGVIALTQSINNSSLRKLHLDNNKIENKGAIALGKSPHFRYLEELQLDRNAIAAEGVNVLIKSQHLENLVTLSLRLSKIDNTGLIALSASNAFSNLRHLNLIGGNIDDAGLIEFAKSSNFPKLKTLLLGYNKISDDSVVALAQSPNFPELKSLCLSSPSVGLRGASAFACSDNFPNLIRLQFHLGNLRNGGALVLMLSKKLHRSIRRKYFQELSRGELEQLAEELGIEPWDLLHMHFYKEDVWNALMKSRNLMSQQNKSKK